jgi:hypothetical protein
MRWQKPQAGICLPLAPTRCGPVGGAELECGKIEMDAPELTKILKKDVAVADSGTEKEGGGAAGWDRSGGSSSVWASRRPISFPGMSSPSSEPCDRSGSGRNTGDHCGCLWTVPGMASGRCQTLAPTDPFPWNREGGVAGPSESRVRPRSSRGCGGLFRGLVLPDLVAALDEVLRLLERPRVDQVPHVARQLAEKEDGLGLLHCGRLQGGEVVPHDGGPCVAAHRIVQPSTRHLVSTKAVGAQEEFLQLFVRVAKDGGVPGQRVDGGYQLKAGVSPSPSGTS